MISEHHSPRALVGTLRAEGVSADAWSFGLHTVTSLLRPALWGNRKPQVCAPAHHTSFGNTLQADPTALMGANLVHDHRQVSGFPLWSATLSSPGV